MNTTENKKFPTGKIILAAVGWLVILSPFMNYTNVDGEEMLTTSSWLILLVFSYAYWHLILNSRWLNKQ